MPFAQDHMGGITQKKKEDRERKAFSVLLSQFNIFC